MIEKGCMKQGINLLNIFKLLKYKRKFWREHPNYFAPDGLVVFTGAQGSGKTLSAVLYVKSLLEKYPLCKLVTNVDIVGYPIDNQRVFPFFDNDDFMTYNNGEYGIIYLVDEIQLYLNSLQSKNVNLEVVTELSQQRKQRKHIVATSQIFGRMAKPLREQFSDVVSCRKMFGCLQCNSLINRDSIREGDATEQNIKGQVKSKYWFIHNPAMYGLYNTYSKIERGKFKDGKEVDLYGLSRNC